MENLKQTEAIEMEEIRKLVSRKHDFENKNLGIRAWVNQTKDGTRTYLALVDKDGLKLFLNKVEAKASPSFSIPVVAQ
jgi:hypothetical protein